MKIDYLYLDGEIRISDELIDRIRKQKKIEQQSRFILNPKINDTYKVVLNHLIEGIHYYTITYYMYIIEILFISILQ